MTLTLPAELEHRLRQEAKLRGIPPEEYTVHLLEASLPPKDGNPQLVAMLQSWLEEGDSTEQKETGDYLIRALDEDRLSDRKLFPPELEGVTW